MAERWLCGGGTHFITNAALDKVVLGKTASTVPQVIHVNATDNAGTTGEFICHPAVHPPDAARNLPMHEAHAKCMPGARAGRSWRCRRRQRGSAGTEARASRAPALRSSEWRSVGECWSKNAGSASPRLVTQGFFMFGGQGARSAEGIDDGF
ncbi:hypothetical protein LTR53_010206, partial [Teratosphaeriaceae sp. CCFEE 6253]